jgi:hypothetical protein
MSIACSIFDHIRPIEEDFTVPLSAMIPSNIAPQKSSPSPPHHVLLSHVTFSSPLPHLHPLFLSSPPLFLSSHFSSSGDDAIARTLHDIDLQEQRARALPFPPIKDPAVTRERKAKFGDGRYGE